MTPETLAIRVAAALTLAATVESLLRRRGGRETLALLSGAVVALTLGLAERWLRLGHGPFTTLYEILASNLWSLSLGLAVVMAASSRVRASAVVVLPVLATMTLWMLAADPRPGHFPPTYSTVLLYVHTLFGKLFLALVLVALALSGVVLLRRVRGAERAFAGLPADAELDANAHAFGSMAFVFQTAMLVAGAVWAQDAWGRFWAWDPLETWAFLTWLALALALHLRVGMRPAPVVNAGMILAVFVLAFLTFFGVPFVSTAPHKGAV